MIVTVRVKKPVDLDVEFPDGTTIEELKQMAEDGELLCCGKVLRETPDEEGTETELYMVEGEYL